MRILKKVGGYIDTYNILQTDPLLRFSNPKKVQELAKQYLGDLAVIFKSTKKNKKYMIYDPYEQRFIHFGQMGMEDYTKHKDPQRKEAYLKRATNIRGNWKNNPYSANNLAIHLLWNEF
jgi:hypothetical protein